jgi:hypothetical protein
VDFRTRAFAGYGLGLVAHASADPAVARLAVMALEQPLVQPAGVPRDVTVAAVISLGLVRAREVREHVVRPLRQFHGLQLSVSDEVAQAQVAPALAAVLCRSGDPSGELADQLSAELEGSGERRGRLRRQSAAIALGELCGTDARHKAHIEALWRYVQQGRDQQTRAFCLIAAARIGGDVNRTALLERLGTTTTIERPWIALALGVLADGVRAQGVDATTGRALHRALRDARNEDVIAACAIGLGLCGWDESAQDLRALLREHRQRDELAGHLCTALALLDDSGAVPLLQEIVAGAARRPQLLTHAAEALGRLGDHSVGRDLAQQLGRREHGIVTLGGIASVLGMVGDRRCIAPLLAVVADPDIPELGRAFAIVGLGGLGDKEDVPWNHKIARHLNYYATVETLTNQVSGILDIL